MSKENFFAWHHLRGVVPKDWEVTRYSMEDRKGRLEFATRHGLCATVSWEPCTREPDRHTTMTLFLANNIIGKKAAKERGLSVRDVSTKLVGNYLLGWLDETMPLQALSYDETGGHLIRWVFEGLTDAWSRVEVVEKILRSCDFNNDTQACEYALFGLHFSLPRDYKIEDMAAGSASVSMCFEGEKNHARIAFLQWGLAELLLDGVSLENFYRNAMRGKNLDFEAFDACRISGFQGLRIRFSAPREFHSDRFMARRWKNGLAYLWHDTSRNRIFCVSQIGPEAFTPFPLSIFAGARLEDGTLFPEK